MLRFSRGRGSGLLAACGCHPGFLGPWKCALARELCETPASTGNLGMRLSYEPIQNRRISFESLRAKAFQMETDGRLAICQCRLVGIALSDDHPFETQWVYPS